MTMNSFFYGIKSIFYATFEFLPPLGDIANWGFIGIMSILFLYWLNVLAKDAKAGKK
ncbi:MAG: hypothetical protein NT150_16125 [Bacteroidetes bacterium]|nr:hypothetical protein [Bacteroidota bacterium]